ncbi:MAG: hypothetical protein WEC33_03270, partial [Dehalococcoidia bacterium]
QEITIAPGDTVRWTNTMPATQSIVKSLNYPYGSFPYYSGWIGPGLSWELTYPSAGTYQYSNHPLPGVMTGTVVVVQGGGGGNPTATPTTGCGGGGGGASTIDVTVTSDGYSPQNVTIAPGDSVRWTNTMPATQNLVKSENYPYGTFPFYSGWIGPGISWTLQFPGSGTYNYSNFPLTPSMTGTVTVSGSCGGGGDPTNTPQSPPTNTPTNPGGGATNTPTKTPTQTSTVPPGSTATNTPTPTATFPGQPPATSSPTPEAADDGFGPLYPGWNLVTYNGPQAGAGQATGELGNKFLVMYYWAGNGYQRYVRPGYAPSWLNTLTFVQDGRVYWIYMAP